MSKKHEMKIIDQQVGRRLRDLCALRGVTQKELADITGVSFQQVQKRMSGTNRMGASILYVTAAALQVPVSYFFDGVLGPLPDGPEEDQLHRRDTLELVRNFHRIPDAETRRKVYSLVKTIADAQHPVAA